MKIPIEEKFQELPNISKSEIMDYFNLEFGYYFDPDADNEKFKENDFEYLGLFKIDGIEAMIWNVKNQKVHAIVQPYENNGYMLGMEQLPENFLELKIE
jgi:hypothetical protein